MRDLYVTNFNARVRKQTENIKNRDYDHSCVQYHSKNHHHHKLAAVTTEQYPIHALLAKSVLRICEDGTFETVSRQGTLYAITTKKMTSCNVWYDPCPLIICSGAPTKTSEQIQDCDLLTTPTMSESNCLRRVNRLQNEWTKTGSRIQYRMICDYFTTTEGDTGKVAARMCHYLHNHPQNNWL